MNLNRMGAPFTNRKRCEHVRGLTGAERALKRREYNSKIY